MLSPYCSYELECKTFRLQLLIQSRSVYIQVVSSTVLNIKNVAVCQQLF